MVYRRCIAICGKKRSGKDTLSNYLSDTYGYTHAKFSEPLKKVVSILFQIPVEHLETDKKEIIHPRWGVSPRRLLQFLGTEVMQFQLQEILPGVGRSFWADNLVQRTSRCTNVVISDLRFQHEVDALKASFDKVTVVKVVRNSYSSNISNDNHTSEIEVETICADHTIHNDADVDTLIKQFSSEVLSYI